VFALEATRFSHGIHNVWGKQDGSGVRLVLLSDLIRSANVYCAIRPLIAGSVHLQQDDIEWAKSLQFDVRVSTTMSATDVLAFGLAALLPPVSTALAALSGLSSRKEANVFCSEFISMLLQRTGNLPASFKKHWSITPLHLTHKVGALDSLTWKSTSPLQWGKEFGMIC